MKKMILAALALAMLAAVPGGAQAGKVVLPENTEISVRFAAETKVSSGTLQPGVLVAIYLADDIKIGGKTIVEAGAEGTAKVEETVAAKRPGKPGMIKLSFVDLSPKGAYSVVDGGKIKLSGSVEDEGGSRKIVSWLFILGLFIKGGQGELDATVSYPATIAETIVLESAD